MGGRCMGGRVHGGRCMGGRFMGIAPCTRSQPEGDLSLVPPFPVLPLCYRPCSPQTPGPVPTNPVPAPHMLANF